MVCVSVCVCVYAVVGGSGQFSEFSFALYNYMTTQAGTFSGLLSAEMNFLRIGLYMYDVYI